MPELNQVRYNPITKQFGWEYWQIGQVLEICYQLCDVPTIIVLADQALTRRPSGMELRNDFILPIRVAAQEWLPREGSAESLAKVVLQRILDDTVADGKPGRFEARKLTLDTVVAFDISHMLREGIFNPNV